MFSTRWVRINLIRKFNQNTLYVDLGDVLLVT